MKKWPMNDWTWAKGRIDPDLFWNVNELKSLTYVRENFNDPEQVNKWIAEGHTPRTGELFDMRKPIQPYTTTKLIAEWQKRGYEHVGVSYCRMNPGDILPYHSDTYKHYISIFNLEERKNNIVRYVLFLEDRKPGHILEVDGRQMEWKAGDWVAWRFDTPHLAANLGSDARYTIQVTGIEV